MTQTSEIREPEASRDAPSEVHASDDDGSDHDDPQASQSAAAPPDAGEQSVSSEAPPTNEVSSSPDSASAQEGASSPDEASPSEEQGSSEASASDEAGATKKKRRRRRRKKKGEATSPGEHEAATATEKHAPRDAGPPLPFQRFFEGRGAARRHAFTVGEVVAGRVLRSENGAIVVDLFGKALAIVDELEPREIPILPEHTHPAPAHAEPQTHAEGHAPTASADVAQAGQATESSSHEASPHGEEGADAPAQMELGLGETQEAQAEGEHHAEAHDDAGHADDHDHPDEEPAHAEPENAQPEVPPPPPVTIGQIFRGRIGAVAESGHVALVNRIIDRDAARKDIETAREERKRVSGLVFGFNRGGFDVLIVGVRAFCPASGMSLEHIDEPEKVVGRKLDFMIAPSKGGHGLVVSRRTILEREARKQAKAMLRSLEEGQRVHGRVTQVRDYGVLVDIGGVEGFVHHSELSWNRGVRPSDVVKPGDAIDVQVLKVLSSEVRKDRQARLSLSLKALLPDPWDEHADVLTPGAVRKGRVVRAAEFGAFIELIPGIEGLLHVSELGKDLAHAGQAVTEGEEIDVIVERVDRKQRRISLSKLSASERQALETGQVDPAQKPKSLKPGSHVRVVVDKVLAHGVLVQVLGVLGKRGRGFIPHRELGGRESRTGESTRKTLGPGTEIEVKIVGLDRDGSLRCSVHALEVDEERRAVKDYRREASRQGFGTFGDLLRAKLNQSSEEN